MSYLLTKYWIWQQWQCAETFIYFEFVNPSYLAPFRVLSLEISYHLIVLECDQSVQWAFVYCRDTIRRTVDYYMHVNKFKHICWYLIFARQFSKHYLEKNTSQNIPDMSGECYTFCFFLIPSLHQAEIWHPDNTHEKLCLSEFDFFILTVNKSFIQFCLFLLYWNNWIAV